MHWTENYIGKPWNASPTPPNSFTCGELCRHILFTRFNIHVPEIEVNASRVRDCLKGMKYPEYYGLLPILPEQQKQEGDIVYMSRTNRPHHVGIAVSTLDGLMILHCQEIIGVTLDAVSALKGMQQMRSFFWYRHETLVKDILCQ